MLLPALLALACAPSFAADYLSLGAAAPVVPLRETAARISSHSLELSALDDAPCYQVIDDTASAAAAEAPENILPVGAAAPCRPDPEHLLIHPLWRAADAYVLTATQDAQVELVLPLHTWAPYQNAKLQVPGVAGFHALADGKEIQNVKLAWVRPK